MGKVVEVARAIYRHKPRNRPWEVLPVEFKRQYYKQASAAIEAMREPSYEMKFCQGWVMPDQAEKIYRSMVTAALSEDKEQG